MHKLRKKTELTLNDLVYFTICTFILAWIANLKIENFTDYFSYYNNFTGNQLAYFYSKNLYSYNLFIKTLNLFTNEILWAVYTDTLSLVFTPSQCIFFTTLGLNLLIFYSIKKLNHPFLALLLWIALPYALTTVGLYQIRQGLAFAIFLYISLRWSKPIPAAIIASLIHTTFMPPLCFLVLHKFLRNNKAILVLSILAFCFLAQLIARDQFYIIAGRRAESYYVDQNNLTELYLIIPWIVSMPNFVYFWKKKVWAPISVAHFSILVWLTLAFFLFPLSTSRISYYLWLFIIPLTDLWPKYRITKIYYLLFTVSTTAAIYQNIYSGRFDILIL